MTGKEFFGKFRSIYLWGNIWAMVVLTLLLCFGVKFGIDYYTHHGEAIVIPNLVHKPYSEAQKIMDNLGLEMIATDTAYVKTLPPDCILKQSITPGKRVKSGHIMYVTVNAASAPTLIIPDIIDNSSLREAQLKLLDLGFRLGEPEYVAGEKDWIYGIKVNGRNVVAGQKVPQEAKLVLVAGDGMLDSSMEIEYVEPEYRYERISDEDEMSDDDAFEVIEEKGNEAAGHEERSAED